MTELFIPRTEDPLLSVVMVTYGGWEWAAKSLTGLVEHTEPVYEVIIVDNASPDGTGERLQERVRGATLVQNATNVGFGPAANQGAALTSGPYLCFLNPDALVQQGWLPPLLEVLQNDPRAGAAVPRLLNLDGTLQEAGSLVGWDGTTWALGHGDDPEDLQYRFRRYVDFGSAACLVMPRWLFVELGGFDAAYVPAYCEDVDLCLSIGARGFRTAYQPRSIVRHARSASTDVQHAQRLIDRNRRILHHRWKEKLATRPSLDDLDDYPNRIFAARDSEELDRILLVLDDVPPNDPDDRASRLVYGTAALWPTARITLIAVQSRVAEAGASALLDRGVEVAAGVTDWGDWLARRRYHYSVVIVRGAKNVDQFRGPLWMTQPQAYRVYYADEENPQEAILWANAVLAAGDSAHDLRARNPEVSVLTLADDSSPEDGDFERSLIAAMARVGVAPPDPASVVPSASGTVH
jgi:GT2 family glycosyltransferase